MSDRPEITRATDENAAAPPRSAGLSLAGRRATYAYEQSPHAEKFRLAIASLTGIAIIALAIAAAIAMRGTTHGASFQWSSWSPPDNGKAGATEIADHIAPLYRATPTSAQQLDLVTLINLANSDTATTTSGSGLEVAVDPTGTLSGLSLLSGKTIAYNLCGLGGGTNCEVGGTASAARLLLLRREALELALYTFKYISGTQNVVAVLPPGHTQSTSTLSAKPPSATSGSGGGAPVTVAVVFVRAELAPWLQEPLIDTLQEFPPAVSQLAAWGKTEEAGLVDEITARGLFSEKIESEQDGANLLVLDSLPPQ